MANQSNVQSLRAILRRTFVRLVRLCAVLVLVLSLASFFARFHWRCEQVCHFRLQYGWLLLLAAVALLAAKDRAFGIVAVAGVIANFIFVVPTYLPAVQPQVSGNSWKLISYNVLSSNDRYLDVANWLRNERADVVLLMEVDDRWARTIETLSDAYPHQHIVAREDNFGIALLSRLPWESVQTQGLGSAELPSIVAKFSLRDLQGTLIGTHPLPPGSAATSAHRNDQLAAIAQLVQETEGAVFVTGDLNITSYSPYFGDLLRVANLRDCRQGCGVQASWSPRLPLLSIPIDHCLVSSQVEIVSRRVGPPLGSDHRPVVVGLRSPR